MSYCGHYWAQGGAWPCTVLGAERPEGGNDIDRQVEGMSTILRAITLCESALRAYEQGATREQLSEYIEAIHAALLAFGGGEQADEAEDSAAGATDTEAPPPLP